jgi:type III secretion system chaperone SycN
VRADDAVTEFGRAVGLDQLSLHPTGKVRMGLPGGEWLSFEEHQDELLVNLVVPAPFVSTSALLEALQACEIRRSGSDLGFQAGLTGQGNEACLVLVTRLPAAQANGAAVISAVDACLDWSRRWLATTGQQSGDGGVGGR